MLSSLTPLENPSGPTRSRNIMYIRGFINADNTNDQRALTPGSVGSSLQSPSYWSTRAFGNPEAVNAGWVSPPPPPSREALFTITPMPSFSVYSFLHAHCGDQESVVQIAKAPSARLSPLVKTSFPTGGKFPLLYPFISIQRRNDRRFFFSDANIPLQPSEKKKKHAIQHQRATMGDPRAKTDPPQLQHSRAERGSNFPTTLQAPVYG